MANCILTPEQFAFMQARHEEIERGLIDNKVGNSAFIDAFVNSEEFLTVFGDMGWDDVYDRYQETPGYDQSLRLALHEELGKDVEAGRIVLPNVTKEDIRRIKRMMTINDPSDEAQTGVDDAIGAQYLVPLPVGKRLFGESE
jgi:hypothetical protein